LLSAGKTVKKILVEGGGNWLKASKETFAGRGKTISSEGEKKSLIKKGRGGLTKRRDKKEKKKRLLFNKENEDFAVCPTISVRGRRKKKGTAHRKQTNERAVKGTSLLLKASRGMGGVRIRKGDQITKRSRLGETREYP